MEFGFPYTYKGIGEFVCVSFKALTRTVLIFSFHPERSNTAGANSARTNGNVAMSMLLFHEVERPFVSKTPLITDFVRERL